EVTGVGHRVHGHDGLEPGSARECQRVLRSAGIGGADRANSSVAPRLVDDPGCRIEAVGRIVGHHVPYAFGSEAAASVLDHADITMAGEELRPHPNLWLHTSLLVVRRALQDCGEFARAALTGVRGEIN